MDANAEHLKTGMWVTVASVVVAVITFVVTRYFSTKQAFKQASPSRAPPSPSPSVKKSFSTNKTLSQFDQLDPALVAALTQTTTPHDSNSDGTRPAASLIPPQPKDLLTPSVPWSRTASSLGPPLVSSRPSSRPPSRPRSPRLPPSMLPGSESAAVVQPPIPWSPSHEDVIAARTALRRFLPLELADKVLHTAEYYPRLTSVLPAHHFDNPLTVSDGRRQVVVSPPVQRPEIIASVLIKTESHDQGWSSYPQDQGTFRNSWTWLDLGVVRNTPGGIPAPEWRIYTNLHATDDWQPTEVSLDMNNETVGALLPGDSLAIWAGARFPGWENNVRSAKIEVIYKI